MSIRAHDMDTYRDIYRIGVTYFIHRPKTDFVECEENHRRSTSSEIRATRTLRTITDLGLIRPANSSATGLLARNGKLGIYAPEILPNHFQNGSSSNVGPIMNNGINSNNKLRIRRRLKFLRISVG